MEMLYVDERMVRGDVTIDAYGALATPPAITRDVYVCSRYKYVETKASRFIIINVIILIRLYIFCWSVIIDRSILNVNTLTGYCYKKRNKYKEVII